MCVTADLARGLASASQPSGKLCATDVRETPTSMRPLAGPGSDASTSGRRSPFRAGLMVCSEDATPDKTGAADTLMLTSVEMVARSRLQAINTWRMLLSLDETKPDVCGAMIRSPSPTMRMLAKTPRIENSGIVPPGNSGGPGGQATPFPLRHPPWNRAFQRSGPSARGRTNSRLASSS
jgi:hypothetical protein